MSGYPAGSTFPSGLFPTYPLPSISSVRMAEIGIGVSAMVAIGSKFVERSKFTARHDAIYDKEEKKSIKLADRFDNIPRGDVDHFEFEEYTMLRSEYVEQYLTQNLTAKTTPDHCRIFATTKTLKTNTKRRSGLKNPWININHGKRFGKRRDAYNHLPQKKDAMWM